jgi:hypothetical protein
MSIKTGSIMGNFGNIKSNADAQKALDVILNAVGLSKNFIIAECNGIENVVASAYRGKRFILAHEVGHHINGHSLDILLYSNIDIDPPTLSKKREQELEADEFAAFILAKLGAKLIQLEEIINNISDNSNDFSSHPPRNKRLIAVNNGFHKSINKQ